MDYLAFFSLLAVVMIADAQPNDGEKEALNNDFTEVNQTGVDTYVHAKETEDIFHVVHSTFEPRIKMYMDRERVASFNYTLACRDLTLDYAVAITSTNPKVLRVQEKYMSISCAKATVNDANTTLHKKLANTSYVIDGSVDVKLMSGLIGYDKINFELSEKVAENETATEETESYDVVVVRKMRPVDRIFRVTIYCVQVFVLIGFGAKLDLQVVKECLRRPIAPLIGFCCQYLMMPLIAFAIGKTVTDESAVSLGIFVAGCCPGGGQSNMYSYLLKGDLSLSITMTTVSTVAALAMLPVWIYSLGGLFFQDQDLKIPFINVVISLSILIVPLTIGVLLRSKFPKCAKRLTKVLKPVILCFVVILLVLGVYSNLFIFRLFRPRVVLAGCLLPYIGYTFGGIVAAICRQPWTRIKTISLETGMQNTSIAYILLTSSFEAPMGDLASVASIASAVMTPFPPLLVTIAYLTYQKCIKKKEDGDEKVTNGKVKGKRKGAVDGMVKHSDEEDVTEKLTAV